MGKKTRKRIIKRRSLPALLLGRKAWLCEQCYPAKEYVEKKGQPLIATIYVGRRKIKIGKSERKLLIAWCAECNRWLAREVKWRITLEDTDIAHELSDGKCGKGKLSWEKFCQLCDDWRKYCSS